ncbi:DUF4239 domain-containing protein [Rhodobacteraceae bacterium NNCM2]|nr:DUF4239 domain-containing protein [Coraliihabitans acroporae]
MTETIGFGIAITFATIGLILAIYFATRRLLDAQPEQITSDLAGSVLFRISALHGLVLALVFASEIAEYHLLSIESASEVSAVADVYNDIARYGTDHAPMVQASLRRYLEVVVGDEWPGLHDTRGLHRAAWQEWNKVYLTVLDLTPANDRQTSLREHMLTQIHKIAEVRDLRKHHALTNMSGLFWFAAVAGVILVAAAYYTFPPTRDNLVLISIFGGYTGIILFTIFALSSPFGEPGALSPDTYADLLETMKSAPSYAE